jgi:hypothetical protein
MRRLLALSLLLVLAGCDNVVPITSTPTATETGSPATGLPTVQSSVTVAPSYTDTPEPLPVATATPAASATATATPDFHATPTRLPSGVPQGTASTPLGSEPPYPHPYKAEIDLRVKADVHLTVRTVPLGQPPARSFPPFRSLDPGMVLHVRCYYEFGPKATDDLWASEDSCLSATHWFAYQLNIDGTLSTYLEYDTGPQG